MKTPLPAAVAASLRDLVTAVSHLVTSVAASATREASSAARSVAATAEEKGAKLSRSIKAHWDTLSPKARAARSPTPAWLGKAENTGKKAAQSKAKLPHNAIITVQTIFGYDVDGQAGPATKKLIATQAGYGWNLVAARKAFVK